MKKHQILIVVFIASLLFSFNSYAAKSARHAIAGSKTVVDFVEGKVVLNKNGKATQGVLLRNMHLLVTGNAYTAPFLFKAGTMVKFDAKGKVVEGVLAMNTHFQVPGYTSLRLFQAGTMVKFNSAGKVYDGTVGQGTTIRVAGGRIVNLTKGTRIVLNAKGEATIYKSR
ncbi:hypothetical protein HW115_09810 [Verrucomicrobiaceae bacterium N1E253]|uniref:Organic solvent tolerance-like N-terminal domain-containing protein n=1 Tax=Oceaniferula marina TaxID=2748318 RepID=A0A851GLF1_9BACT|nr:hypothetical protein [Oceaniferula marina]NWK55907.1 hypothetical protein [Oceaniferula marina]